MLHTLVRCAIVAGVGWLGDSLQGSCLVTRCTKRLCLELKCVGWVEHRETQHLEDNTYEADLR